MGINWFLNHSQIYSKLVVSCRLIGGISSQVKNRSICRVVVMCLAVWVSVVLLVVVYSGLWKIVLLILLTRFLLIFSRWILVEMESLLRIMLLVKRIPVSLRQMRSPVLLYQDLSHCIVISVFHRQIKRLRSDVVIIVSKLVMLLIVYLVIFLLL